MFQLILLVTDWLVKFSISKSSCMISMLAAMSLNKKTTRLINNEQVINYNAVETQQGRPLNVAIKVI